MSFIGLVLHCLSLTGLSSWVLINIPLTWAIKHHNIYSSCLWAFDSIFSKDLFKFIPLSGALCPSPALWHWKRNHNVNTGIKCYWLIVVGLNTKACVLSEWGVHLILLVPVKIGHNSMLSSFLWVFEEQEERHCCWTRAGVTKHRIDTDKLPFESCSSNLCKNLWVAEGEVLQVCWLVTCLQLLSVCSVCNKIASPT